MINIYWAPWHHPSVYSERHLSYKKKPYWLIEEFNQKNNTSNKVDNFYKCPAFVNLVKNTLVLSNTSNIDINITADGTIVNNDNEEKSHAPGLFSIKSPSEVNARTVNYSCNWIFFADKPVDIVSSPAYMHNTGLPACGYYVPGTFDISKWFRPLEFAFQMWPGSTKFKMAEDDPLMYVKFNTEEKINLQEFYMTPEIYSISNSCVSLKNFSRVKALNKLYEVFRGSGMREKLLTEIQKNII